MKISAITGIISIVNSSLSTQPSQLQNRADAARRGATAGQITEATPIITINTSASRKPGMNPARNSRPMDSPTVSPYSTSRMLGGIRMPKVPPAASDPTTSRSW